jgi:hypothetical protein
MEDLAFASPSSLGFVAYTLFIFFPNHSFTKKIAHSWILCIIISIMFWITYLPRLDLILPFFQLENLTTTFWQVWIHRHHSFALSIWQHTVLHDVFLAHVIYFDSQQNKRNHLVTSILIFLTGFFIGAPGMLPFYLLRLFLSPNSVPKKFERLTN